MKSPIRMFEVLQDIYARPVDVNISRLTDTMTAILCLSVHCGVPVTVIEYDRVSSGEVHTNTTRARGQDKHEDTRIHVKPVHQDLQSKCIYLKQYHKRLYHNKGSSFVFCV